MAMDGNFYEILDVPNDASAELIREAYKKMAFKWHPDKNIGNKDEADARFKQIAQAYHVLSDNDKRLRYDRSQNSCGHQCDNSDDSLDVCFGFFMTPDIFRHVFRHFSQDMQYDRQRMNYVFSKGGRQGQANADRRHCYRNEAPAPSTTIRNVNGKRWVTMKFYEDGKEIITRHEDGELVSKHIDGVAQPKK